MKTAACTTNSQAHIGRVASPLSPGKHSWSTRSSSALPWPRVRLQNERWRSRRPKQLLVRTSFRRLVDFENLVGRDVSQHLDYATRPANLNALYLLELASSEVDACRTGGRIAHGRRHVVELIAQFDSCADPVAIASGAD